MSDQEEESESERIEMEETTPSAAEQKKIWRPEDFKKRECNTFIEDSSRDGWCQCGCPRDKHPADIKTAENNEWTTELHSSEQQTDAYGALEFEGEKYLIPFLRLSSDTEPSLVYDMMTRKEDGGWCASGLPPPLVVSVVGGEGRSEVKPWVQEVIREGLVKALAKTATGDSFPWILTEGFDEGVGRCVGEAVGNNRVLALAIAPWGLVYNREQLVNPKDTFHVQYSVENRTSASCCLEKNHLGFLLVDDGREGHRGGENNFRVKLFEEHIPTRHIKDTSSITIPVLCVLASGELSMLERVCASLENNTPWLVMAGSGGMAEFLSDIFESQSDDDINRVCFKHFHVNAEAQWDQICRIYDNKALLTFYHEEKDRPEDFDKVIIKALMPASKRCASGKTFPYGRELFLALKWNREDFASSQLFKRNIKINKMFLDLIVNILTVGRLEDLYREVKKDTLIYKLLLENLKGRLGTSDLDSLTDISLLEVSGVLKKFMGKEKPFYFTALGLEDFTSGKKALEDAKDLLKGERLYRNDACKSPWFDLFIWAVLENHGDWAVCFWEETEEPVLNALSACKMLKEMSKMEYETETKRSLEELSLRFENLADDVMGPCYQSSKGHFFQLLNRESPVWGTNCFQMAMAAESVIFFNHDGLEVLSQVWWGDMKRDTPVWKFLLTFFFPLLLCTNLITFSDADDSRWEKFWSASITKFVSNAVMYILFLFLFAYVLLVDFKPAPPSGPSISECVLYFWVFTFLCEEIRQAFSVRLYWKDKWNRGDIAAIILFIIGVICRMFDRYYEFGRGVLCIDYMVFTIRLIHISTIHKEMGPKIIIVGEMMKDVGFFLFFLGVWILAYGVATQALLYPYDPDLDRIFRRVLYRPYLYIFGDLSLEEIDVYGKAWDQNCTTNMTLVDDFTEPCRSEFNNWMVIVLLVVFLLVTNILLINLLIAILSNTFSKVDSDSKTYWRIQHYKLVKEFKDRPALAPPFIILSHIYLFCKHRCCGANQSPLSKPNDPNIQHPGIYCDSCRMDPIVGIRYQCTVCPDYDLCSDCQSTGCPLHKEHPLRSIEPPFQEWEMEQKQKFLTAQSPERSSDSERMKQISDKVENVLKQETFDQRIKMISEKMDRMEKQQQNQMKQLTEHLTEQLTEKLTAQFTAQLNETKAALESKVENALAQILDRLPKPPSS